ncbi:MAG: hypothetical protein MRZ66_05895 [Clostridiales bacterium]|nr:hypothetical protein [Clostridiales bacterium]
MAIRIKIVSLDTAIRIYYENPEIGNAEIGELFGTKSSSTIKNLKKKAQDLMITREKKSFWPYTVNTAIAYEAWGLDIEDLERRRTKLKKFGLVG